MVYQSKQGETKCLTRRKARNGGPYGAHYNVYSPLRFTLFFSEFHIFFTN